MFHFRILGPLCATLYLSAPAFAEDLLFRNGCAELVRDYAIGSPEQRVTHSLGAAPIPILVPEDLSNLVYNKSDPIALSEEWSPAGPLVRHKSDILSNDGVLNCAEIVVDFRVGERITEGQEGRSLYARNFSGEITNAKLRVLALDLVDSRQEALDRYWRWEDSSHRIAVQFDPIINGESILVPSTFSGLMDFFPGGAQGDESHILAVPIEAQSPFAIEESFGPIIQRILVMCSETCSEIYETVQNAGQASLSAAPSASPVPDTLLSEAIEQPQGTNIGDTQPPEASLPSPYVSFTIEAAGMTSGGLSTDGFADAGSFACLVDAVAPGAGVFFNPPDCSGNLVEEIRDRHDRISIRLTDDGQWIFGQHVPDASLERITVTLPAGVNGSLCRMAVTVGASDALTTLPLEYVPGSNPAAYTAQSNPAIPPEDGTVTVRIDPSSAASCGGGPRQVVANAAAQLTIPLLEEPLEKTAFVYLFIPDFGTNELELETTEATARALSQGLVQAALSAHHRLAVTNPDALFRIQESLGISLSQNGSNTLFRLDADQLRNSNVASRNLDEQAEALSRNSFPFSQNQIFRGLTALADEAQRSGFQKIEVLIAGGVMQNDSIVPANPCAPATFDTIRVGISKIEGLDLRAHVMPIVKLEPGQIPDFSAQQPLTFSANATGQPGGLFRCEVGSETPLSVYPFYIESWRETRDAIPRLTAAMTDQAAVLLEEYVK